MVRKGCTPEQIINKFREAEVMLSQGATVAVPFTTLEEAKVLIEAWRKEYNQVRPHSALGYRPPGPETILVVATR